MHGRGPVDESAETLVAEAVSLRPPNFAETLAALELRPRLSQAVPMVAHLAGALTLPARKLSDHSPPVGGYADVTTRGLPEQILPSQFALDDLEFLRRFAGGELLYYHREQPRASIDEDMVVIVDQGVRTWGDVRLILSAAALAFARQAIGKGTDLLLATTSEDRPEPVARLDADALGNLLEASDFTSHPGEVLGRILEWPADRPRDVILLTHPRSLLAEEVALSARKLRPGTRLFAVAVDSSGSVELSELRRGIPVALGRCRVTIDEPRPAPVKPLPVSSAPSNGWRGDVEPIGFPFRLGVLQPLDERKFAFDHDGDWVLAVSGPLALLYAWKLDESRAEMLPRALVGGRPLTTIESVVGVAGGFVVVGWHDTLLVAAHYDFADRSCAVHRLDASRFVIPKTGEWSPLSAIYVRHLHCVVVRSRHLPQLASAVDLMISKPFAAPSKRAIQAEKESQDVPTDPLPIIPPGCTLPASGSFIQLIPQNGLMLGRIEGKGEFRVAPVSDGQPALKAGRLLHARRGGDVLGTLVENSKGSRKLQFHQIGELVTDRPVVFSADTANTPEPPGLRAYPSGPDDRSFAMSEDGLYFARLMGKYSLEVRLIKGTLLPTLRTAREPFHNRLEVELGNSCLLVRTGSRVHAITWLSGSLNLIYTGSGSRWATMPGLVRARPRGVESPYDPARFVAGCRLEGLSAWVDSLGHVAIVDAKKQLIAMFYVFRQQIAAWMPDGTRLGPPAWIGGPSSPNAAEKIGTALLAAGKGEAVLS